ncbi:hypothetical protein PTSG_12190 [Salpingoeca rosetta]|uniref:Protein-tyrosine sulfotransferase n=1 Tax=Salpingoeca rosetta (strain ATCC 50818 / BSB-021) TaxID=946362 RepID=F2U7R6_SALR5|nr:uncharacterized protein PTSG_12190 [Salpingoeca rosetta]EGD72821.1 hypothetical protein PTSG_12190 [Salpingoeca rosetta]|eukprot:XP_004994644.1 hypothetical protein PTSG_12190 [Salpingoeca rosetta]
MSPPPSSSVANAAAAASFVKSDDDLFTFTPKHMDSTLKLNFMGGVLLWNWIRFLWRFRSIITWRVYWRRILAVTFASIVSTAFAIIEWILNGAKIRNAAINKRPVFVLGHPRSGTTLLHNLLSENTTDFFCPTTFIVGLHKSFIWRYNLRHKHGQHLTKTRPMDDVALNIDTPQEDEFAYLRSTAGVSMYASFIFMSHSEELKKYIRLKDVDQRERDEHKSAIMDFVRRLSVMAKGRRLLLKSPSHTGKVKLLLELFPDAQFVYIHRNPYRVYRSTINLFDKLLWYNFLSMPTNAQMNEFVFAMYEELFAGYMEDRKLIPKHNLVEISYDELQADKIGTIRKVYEQLGWPDFETVALPKLKEHLNEIRDFQKNVFEPLTSAQRDAINRRWGAAFEAFGYDMETGNSDVHLTHH